MSAVSVREAGRRDRPAVAAVLGRAFQVEPVYHWLYPDPDVRARRLGPLMHTWLAHLHAGMGVVEIAVDGAERVVGAAMWDRPGAVHSGAWRTARALPGLVRATGRDLPRLVALGDAMDRARPREPHWYLFHLGADPRLQRGGIGTALLRSMLARCDAGAYLECCDANLDYYRRFGFVEHDPVVVDGDLSVRTMWRDAGPLP